MDKKYHSSKSFLDYLLVVSARVGELHLPVLEVQQGWESRDIEPTTELNKTGKKIVQKNICRMIYIP